MSERILENTKIGSEECDTSYSRDKQFNHSKD